MKYELDMAYRIMMKTEDGRIVDGEYGYGQTFKWDRFDSMGEAIEALTDRLDEIDFTKEYLIVPVVTKRWAD